MDSTSDLIIDSLKEEPIGETDHFIWFITDIGIAALFKRQQNYEIYSSNVEIEANKIGLDIHQIIVIGFFIFVLKTSNPFNEIFPVQTEGLGLNPILQD